MGKLIILFNRNVLRIFDEYFNRAIHRVASSVWEIVYVFVYVVLSKGMPFETVNVARENRACLEALQRSPRLEATFLWLAGLTERVGPQNTSGARSVGGARCAHPC